jgi:hypothetical protein
MDFKPDQISSSSGPGADTGLYVEGFSPFSRYFMYEHFPEMIKAIVGKEEVIFMIHKGVLLGAADYFKYASNSRWRTEKGGGCEVIQ